MTDNPDVATSPLPNNAIFLSLIICVTGLCFYFLGLHRPISITFAVVTLFGSLTWVLSLRRWLKSDIATRPKMVFPKTTVTTLFFVVFAVLLFVVWLDRELSSINMR